MIISIDKGLNKIKKGVKNELMMKIIPSFEVWLSWQVKLINH